MTVTINGTTGITNDGGYTGDGVVFSDTTPSNTLVTTTGGNVGVGTSSPDAKLRVNGGGNSLQARFSGVDNRGLAISTFTSVGTSDNGVTYNAGVASDAQHVWQCGGTERARIDSSGNLLVGTTSNSTGARIAVSGSGTGGAYLLRLASSATGGSTADGLEFVFGDGVAKGSIRWNSTITAYNTSSDYRLKNTIAPMTGALAKVALLKPCTYKWNVDGSDGEGFIAHELAEVVPGCVTGEKDAVDADGNPKYQGIDTSFLVATLTAAIQELKAIVDAQVAEIAALKGTQP
jgi:hypothetical protein